MAAVTQPPITAHDVTVAVSAITANAAAAADDNMDVDDSMAAAAASDTADAPSPPKKKKKKASREKAKEMISQRRELRLEDVENLGVEAAAAYAGAMGVSKRGHQSAASLKELIKGWFAQHGESAVFVPSGPAGDGAPP